MPNLLSWLLGHFLFERTVSNSGCLFFWAAGPQGEAATPPHPGTSVRWLENPGTGIPGSLWKGSCGSLMESHDQELVQM